MLLRVAYRRKAQADPYRHLRPLVDQLLLPWLCPAQYTRSHHSESRSSTTVGGGGEEEPSIRRSVTDRSRQWMTQRRNLATAVAERESSHEDYVPFQDWSKDVDDAPTTAPHRWTGSASLSDLRPLDISSPIVINQGQSKSKLPSRVKIVNGMSSDVDEIHMMLEACLRVDRFERAAVFVRRLASIYTPEAPELLTAHNQYLTALVAYLLSNPSESHLNLMQTWFEVDMKAKGVRPDATTYAVLLKASIRVLEGPKLERTIRRYMDLAVFTAHDEEVFGLPILSDAELNRIAQVCPTEYHLPDPDVPGVQTPPPLSVDDTVRLATMPELRPVQQKGLGLESLKKSISLFSDTPLPYPDDLKGTKEEKDLAYAIMRQKKIEEDSIASAVERWQEENQTLQKLGLSTVLQTKTLGALMWDWHVALKAELQKELRRIEESEGQAAKSQEEVDRRLYGPFMRLLPVDKLSAITILSIMSLLSINLRDRAMSLATTITQLADAVYQESTAELIQKQAVLKASGRPNTAERQQKLANLMKRRRTFEALARGLSDDAGEPVAPQETIGRTWSLPIKVKLGVVLVSSLLRVAKVTAIRTNLDTNEEVLQTEPAFFHSYQYLQGKKSGVIVAHTRLAEQLRKEPASHTLARHLPMIVEPRRWRSFSDGGFLQYAVNVMRTKDDGFQRRYIEAAARRGDMAQMFAGLDVLARTPWRVNRAIFEVMVEAWNSGDAIANFAPADANLQDPPEPESSTDQNARRQWIKALREVENKKSAMHSLRCFQNFQLEVARAYVNEKFYFPHNLDFRGRAYPTPPYLNHLGADNARGLLIFADGKELGHSGLSWLKVHLASVYGYDKASFQERKEFAMQHLPDVYDSASNPLKGRRWWLTAEDPWQCLATCIELRNALESPDPARFISRLPVHQDGTCNGLQHYAALGGDEWGARQVNLEPGERPADVYNAVAELVNRQTVKDAKAGHPVAQKLVGKITRKVVKPTVMTNVYGVTYVGALAQVQKQLVETVPELAKERGRHFASITHYIVQHIFRALSRMFHGAHEIQGWLGECAGRISDSVTPEQMEQAKKTLSNPRMHSVKKLEEDICFKTTVVWTTPLKMPVTQPYYKEAMRHVKTNLQKVSILEERETNPVNRRKQLQAFPPNFIHSLDASHMLLSALSCEEKGITFAAVHDSFWTHAGDIDTLNRILRDAFIRIHQEDVMGRLAEEFRARYKGCLRLAKVRASSAVAAKILAWRRSRTSNKMDHTPRKVHRPILRGHFKITELLEEYERQTLLQSDKPDEREKGRQMVTAASIFEENGGSEADFLYEARKASDMERLTELDMKDDSREDPVSDLGETVDTDAETEAEAEEEKSVSDDDEAGVEEEVEEVARAVKKKRPMQTRDKITLWLPLTFPPVPKKGAFDVTRLSDSKYFFC